MHRDLEGRTRAWTGFPRLWEKFHQFKINNGQLEKDTQLTVLFSPLRLSFSHLRNSGDGAIGKSSTLGGAGEGLTTDDTFAAGRDTVVPFVRGTEEVLTAGEEGVG